MHIEIFRQAALENSTLDLGHLIRDCCHRFLSAASLLEINSPRIDGLQKFHSGRLDCEPLIRPYRILLQRYINEFYSPQLSLIDAVAYQEDQRWQKFFYHKFIPLVTANNEAMRNILRSVKAIPSSDSLQAIESLCQYISDLTLPDTQPLWIPEKNIK